VFPRAPFTRPREAEYVLLKPNGTVRLLDLGRESGAAADYLASRRRVEIARAACRAPKRSERPWHIAKSEQNVVAAISIFLLRGVKDLPAQLTNGFAPG
jgi:hypothetical protein